MGQVISVDFKAKKIVGQGYWRTPDRQSKVPKVIIQKIAMTGKRMTRLELLFIRAVRAINVGFPDFTGGGGGGSYTRLRRLWEKFK